MCFASVKEGMAVIFRSCPPPGWNLSRGAVPEADREARSLSERAQEAWGAAGSARTEAALSASLHLPFAVHDSAPCPLNTCSDFRKKHSMLRSPLSHWHGPEDCFLSGQVRLAGTFRSPVQYQEPRRVTAAGKFGVLSRCPWRRKRRRPPVLLLGKLHGWRSLQGYSPWSR